MELSGSCHCGAVRFRVYSPEPYPYQACYCSICRKTAGGGGYAINLGADFPTMEVEGQENVRSFHARVQDPEDEEARESPASRYFCGLCGSALWIYDPRWPELVHPFASAIDTPLPEPPETVRIMLEFAPAWCKVPEEEGERHYDRYPEESLEEWHRRHGLYDEKREMTSRGEMSAQPESARQQSRADWGAAAPGWYAQREALWKASRPVSEWMIGRLDPQPGDTVLELAAGLGDTGLIAARLVGESGRVIVTDFAPAMVAAARERADKLGISNVEFRVLDAERMDLETDSVDGVLCRWGYMLMIDPAAAFAETRRVLRPGGRLAFSVWAARELNPQISLPGAVLVEMGFIPPPDPEAPGAFVMADPARIRKLVVEAGFAEPEIEEVPIRWRFADQDAYWRFLTETAASFSRVLRTLSPEALNRVRERVHEAARPFYSNEGYVFPAVCLNAVTY